MIMPPPHISNILGTTAQWKRRKDALDQTNTEWWDVMAMLMQGLSEECAGRCDESSVDSTYWRSEGGSAWVWTARGNRSRKRIKEEVFFALLLGA